MRERPGIHQIVDGDELEVGAAIVGGVQDAASDAAKAVDGDTYGHGVSFGAESTGRKPG